MFGEMLDHYMRSEGLRSGLALGEMMKKFSLICAINRNIGKVGTGPLLQQPEKLLSFVDHALYFEDEDPAPAETAIRGLPPLSKTESGEEGAENDAMQQAAEILKAGMVPAALALLVDILSREWSVSTQLANPFLPYSALTSGNENMNAENTPLLKPIVHKIRRKQEDPEGRFKEICGPLLLLLDARSELAAQVGAKPRPRHSSKLTARQKGDQQYEEALKLLQDVSVPVRAHGLVLLSELVGSLEPGVARKAEKPELDPAKLPKILDFMMTALRDEDSYVYLNAVKGLARFGLLEDQTMFRRLLHVYTTGANSQGVPAEHLTASSVDKRLRVGEALQQIVQRLGAAIAPKCELK